MTPSEHIDQRIAGLTDWRGAFFAHLRKTILAADPLIVEEWKWMGTPIRAR
jgi:hypothetical protein